MNGQTLAIQKPPKIHRACCSKAKLLFTEPQNSTNNSEMFFCASPVTELSPEPASGVNN